MLLYILFYVYLEEASRVVAVFKVNENVNLSKLYQPCDGTGGLNEVVEAYKELLTDIVGASCMEDFFVNYKYEYVDMFREFKRKIREPQGKKKVTIKFASTLIRTLENSTGEKINDIISKSKFRGKIQFYPGKIQMTSDIFHSLYEVAGYKIIAHLNNVMKNPGFEDVNSIMIISVIADACILQDMVKQAFPRQNVVISPEYRYATLIGSVICGYEFKSDSRIVSSRVEKFVKIFTQKNHLH